MTCYRGHDMPRDKQHRCIGCRRLYDRARSRSPHRMESKRQYIRSALGLTTQNIRRAVARIEAKRSRILNLEAELAGV